MPKSKSSHPAAKAVRRRVAPAAKKTLITSTNKNPRSQKRGQRVAKAPAPSTPPDTPRGKLGAIVAAVSAEAGATLAELAALTDWQPHTTRAALCRLRQRGLAVTLAERAGRKAYRLDAQS